MGMVGHPVTFKLRTWRRNHGLSQADAAAKLGVARRTWHLWEHGARIPEPDNLLALVQITGGAIEANDFYRMPEKSAA